MSDTKRYTLRQEFYIWVEMTMKYRNLNFDQAAQYVYENYNCGKWWASASEKQISRLEREIKSGNQKRWNSSAL